MSKYILRELCKNVTDGEHGTVPYEIGSPYYLLSAKNLLNGKIVLTDNERTISKQSFDKIRKRTGLEKDDVLISTVGTIGNLAIADEVSYYEFNRDVGIFKCNKEKLIPEYLYYFLSTNAQQKRMMKIAKGVTQKHLYISDLEEIDIDIPNVQEQSKAIHLLKRMDGKIGLNKKVISNLESMSKTLYDYWFVQFDFPNDNGHPYKTSGGKMEWNEILSREIPTGWEVGQVSDLGEVVAGGTPSTEYPEYFASDGIAWITPKDMSLLDGKYIFHGATDISEEGLKNSSAKLMPAGSVVYTTRAPIGYVAIAGNDVCTNQGFKSVVPKKEFGTEFVYYTLKSLEVHFKNVGNGSTFSEVSKETFSTVPICIPEREVIKKFIDAVDKLSYMQKKAQMENIKLIALRDFLLPMLMNGQVIFIN